VSVVDGLTGRDTHWSLKTRSKLCESSAPIHKEIRVSIELTTRLALGKIEYLKQEVPSGLDRVATPKQG
jgi:hypothetical protein